MNMTNPQSTALDELDFDKVDFDAMLGDLADMSVIGGFDSENDDSCQGGACKI